MNVELLTASPISGSIRERHFDVKAAHNAWVRFDDGIGGEWVGVFGASEPSKFYAVAPFGDDGGVTVLVIAGGQGYVVDGQSGTLLRRTSWWYSQAVVAPPQCEYVIVADDTRAWAAGRQVDRPVWRRDRASHDSDRNVPAQRLALDGIIFHGASASQVAGRVWEAEGWYAFTIDMQTLEFKLGDFLSQEWHLESSSPAV